MKTPESFLQEKEYSDLPVFLERLRERVVTVERERIQETSFVDLYGNARVQKDLEFVEEAEEKFEKEASKNYILKQNKVWGDTLEAFLHTQINKHQIFGENVVGIRTSRFDDLKAGIDEIVAFVYENGVAHFGLGIDYTFGNPTRKIENNIALARAGTLPSLRYFESKLPGWEMRGALKTPRVVFGVSRDSIRQDLAWWLENNQQAINQSELQMLFVMQIADQLDVYNHVAHPSIKEQYRKALTQIEEIKTAIRKRGMRMGKLKDDPVYQLMRQQLGSYL